MIEAAARRLVRILPEGLALALTCQLAERPRPLPLAPAQQEALRMARRLSYGAGGRQVAWSWGEGPVVMLVHGWGGRAAQMAPLALSLARAGYRGVAPDITGHGGSPDRRSSWGHFLGDVAALAESLNEKMHACIGHSAGGLALMGARTRHGLRAERYVCICAPSFPYPPIVIIGKRINPPPAVLKRYKDYIAGQFGIRWSALEAGQAYADAGDNLLLVYDEADRYLDGRDAERIVARCGGAQVIRLRGHGHQRILAAPELAAAIGGFLAAGIPAAEALP